ncbi:hypothetical protein ACFSSA_11505 [Luteolibacter algae]|uniref:Uncharacterized protein n=1 Tax=Luteolibacter algae TaxID=454151 RepID=A0ABW5D8C5_9BACT
MSDKNFTESRSRQIFVGVGIILTFTVVIVSFLAFWRKVPGVLGEGLGMVAGIISTPFFMEASFFVMGMIIVVAVNTWRRHKGGDELIYLNEKDYPDDL